MDNKSVINQIRASNSNYPPKSSNRGKNPGNAENRHFRGLFYLYLRFYHCISMTINCLFNLLPRDHFPDFVPCSIS